MIINGLSLVALDKKFGNWSNTPLDDWNKKNYDKNGINAIRNEILLRISPALTREGQSKHFPGSNFTNWYEKYYYFEVKPWTGSYFQGEGKDPKFELRVLVAMKSKLDAEFNGKNTDTVQSYVQEHEKGSK